MRRLTVVLVVFVGTLAFAELVVRLLIAAHMPAVGTLDFDFKIDNRLYYIWHSPFKRQTAPPFAKLSNRETGEPDRMKDVYSFSYIDANADYNEPDFLLPPDPKNTYHVHIDKDRFRGSDHENWRDKKTLRILCLGSYLTFGQGVDNDKIWTALLEKKLAKTLHRPVAVLNAGLNSGTAIMGLSRLMFEGQNIKPDIIIIEYGFLDGNTSDAVIADDPRFKNQKSIIETAKSYREAKLWRMFISNPVLRHSYLAYKIFTAILPHLVPDDEESRQKLYRKSLELIFNEGKKYTNNFIALYHPFEFSGAMKKFTDRQLVVRDLLLQHKSEFDYFPKWLDEFNVIKEQYLGMPDGYKGFFGAFINPFQLGPRAHELIAEALENMIVNTVVH